MQVVHPALQLGSESVAGGMEMNPMVPAQVPSSWMVYFTVDDVDNSFRTAIGAGGREMLEPHDFPGGRFAILSDPQGAVFGVIKRAERQESTSTGGLQMEQSECLQ
jgi:hypothetical protein